MKKLFSILIGSLIVSSFFVSAIAIAQSNSSDTSETINVKKGKSLQIVLDSNGSTGYGWMYLMDPYEKKVKFSKAKYSMNSSDPELVGGGGKETLTFKALKEGETRIILEYVRSFDLKNPAKIHTVTVKVSK